MKQIKRRRLQAEAWRELAAQFVDSGLSVRTFCARHGVNPSTFSWWRWRLNARSSAPVPTGQSAPPAGPGQFVDLGTLRPAASRERFELRLDLGAGLVLHLVRG